VAGGVVRQAAKGLTAERNARLAVSQVEFEIVQHAVQHQDDDGPMPA
jgi:hypothetical protein